MLIPNRRLSPSALLLVTTLCASALAADGPMRPPSVPLVAHDPYFSLWSPADKLTDTATTHWTGKVQPIRSLVRIDGKTYRVMGTDPADAPPLPQTGVEVLPTRTNYTFSTAEMRLRLTFLTPALPDDLDLLARPVTYITWAFKSNDGKPHDVQVYFDCGAEIAVDTPDQQVKCESVAIPGLQTVRVGSADQPTLKRQGDDTRIDWGYAYLAVEASPTARVAITPGDAARGAFAKDGSVPAALPAPQATPAKSAPVLAASISLGKVTEPATCRAMLGYDDEFSIRYFDDGLRPYWRRKGMDAAGLLTAAAKEYTAIDVRCRQFDDTLMQDLTKIGGPGYAQLASLSYRQTLAGCKLAADAKGQPLLFPKENHSNGCIGTVDVIYPMAPFTLLFSPALTKAMLVPVLDYGASRRWKFDYAPHDLGTYPHATGQVYGGGEKTDDRQMPVEESANLLLLVAALAKSEGNADFAKPYWPLLTKWAEYLRSKGFDPENQLCTDDFAGHLAHNVNLSAKAIVALGAFAQLAEMRGDGATAKTYRDLAAQFAARWVKEADDGDHFKLAFDKQGTWSQKYNLVWDRLLGLKLFPADALRKEMDYYRKHQNPYGLALDNRSAYTKLDWTVWTASLTGNRDDFDALIAPLNKFINETPDRSPLTDWFFTDSGKKKGFTARPVVGGVFIPLLGDPDLWHKWATHGVNSKDPWAPIPIHAVSVIVPTAEDKPIDWQYAQQKPLENWAKPDFKPAKPANWKTAPAPFGVGQGDAAVPVRTIVKKGDIWLRRDFDLKDATLKNPRLRFWAGGDVEIYINGVLATQQPGGVRGYQQVVIDPAALKSLHPGKNVLAVQAQTGSGPKRNRLDVGIVELQGQ